MQMNLILDSKKGKKMKKGKVRDFLSSVSEEGFQTMLESEYVPEVVTSVADMVTTEGTSLFLGSVIGAAAPRANSIRMNYLQKRFEKRVESALRIMQNQISSIENNYATLNDEMQEKFRGLYVEWLMDNLYSERQPEKVTSHVNGYINMMTNDTNDDIMIMFMDTLNQLTQLDIDVLKLYTISSNESAWDLIGRYGIQPEQLKVIKEKLTRFGLIYSKQDDLRDDNIDAVVKYLLAVETESKKRNPKSVKMKDIKKPKTYESYSITGLGRDFLLKISN